MSALDEENVDLMKFSPSGCLSVCPLSHCTVYTSVYYSSTVYRHSVCNISELVCGVCAISGRFLWQYLFCL